jgi:hypothetical protein
MRVIIFGDQNFCQNFFGRLTTDPNRKSYKIYPEGRILGAYGGGHWQYHISNPD